MSIEQGIRHYVANKLAKFQISCVLGTEISKSGPMNIKFGIV